MSSDTDIDLGSSAKAQYQTSDPDDSPPAKTMKKHRKAKKAKKSQEDEYVIAGREIAEEEEIGKKISSTGAKYLETVFTTVNKDKIKQKQASYKRPKNTKHLVTPATNERIWKILPPWAKARDSKLLNVMNDITKATIAIAHSAEKNQSEKADLLDAMAFLGKAHQSLKLQRIDQQRTVLPPEYKNLGELLDGEDDAPDKLYGGNLKNKMKEAKELTRLETSLQTRPFKRKGDSTYTHSHGQPQYKKPRYNFLPTRPYKGQRGQGQYRGGKARPHFPQQPQHNRRGTKPY